MPISIDSSQSVAATGSISAVTGSAPEVAPAITAGSFSISLAAFTILINEYSVVIGAIALIMAIKSIAVPLSACIALFSGKVDGSGFLEYAKNRKSRKKLKNPVSETDDGEKQE